MVGFGIDRCARSRKARGGLRGWLGGGKSPDGRELGERLARLARRLFGSELVELTARRMTLDLHPAAPRVRVTVRADGDLHVDAETGGVGPGYHAHVLARLAPLLDELELAWVDDAPDPTPGMLAWFARELTAGAARVGVPPERTFVVDAAVQTACGPRDAAWCDAVRADPARAADAFLWWETGPGMEARSRALYFIWHEVPWREPLDDDERALLERVDAELRATQRANPTLALPWPEWAWILDELGDTSAPAAAVRARAAGTPATAGYRRYPLEITLAGDWLITLPGAFVANTEDDGARWWATDGERLLEFTSLTAQDSHDSAALLAVAPERYAVIARSADGTHCGRLEAHTEGEIRIVHGLVAAAPEVALLTCKSRDPDDAWAITAWRSLRRPPA